jgi:hypothetical protein
MASAGPIVHRTSGDSSQRRGKGLGSLGVISRKAVGVKAFFQGFSGSAKSSSVGPSKVRVAGGKTGDKGKQARPVGGHDIVSTERQSSGTRKHINASKIGCTQGPAGA